MKAARVLRCQTIMLMKLVTAVTILMRGTHCRAVLSSHSHRITCHLFSNISQRTTRFSKEFQSIKFTQSKVDISTFHCNPKNPRRTYLIIIVVKCDFILLVQVFQVGGYVSDPQLVAPLLLVPGVLLVNLQ